MTHTVVGVFDTNAAAEQAREALLASGFSRDSITLKAGSALGSGAARSAAEPGHEGFVSGIREFFMNLFGSGEHGEYADHYSEAVRRGGAVLSVDVMGVERIELAKDTLARGGAVDIDDRLAQWRAEGYEAGSEAGYTATDPADPDAYARDEAGGYEAGLPADAGLSPAAGIRDGGPPSAAVRPDSSAAFPGAEHDPVRVYPRVGSGPTPGLPGSLDAFDDQFRDDFRTRYTPEDGAYEDFAPAYHHGYTLASDERYRGSDWATSEAEVQRDWESRYPGSSWEKFKLAVRHGWERVTHPL